MVKYIQSLDNVCIGCGNERTVNEYGYCSTCMEKPDKEYDVSPIIIYPFGYADSHRPAWHKKINF